MAARLSCSTDSRPLLSFNASDAERERDLKSSWHCATLTHRETGFTQVLLHKYTRICTETFSEAHSCTLLNPGLHRSWQLLNLANSLGLWESLTLICSGADYCCVPLTQLVSEGRSFWELNRTLDVSVNKFDIWHMAVLTMIVPIKKRKNWNIIEYSGIVY